MEKIVLTTEKYNLWDQNDLLIYCSLGQCLTSSNESDKWIPVLKEKGYQIWKSSVCNLELSIVRKLSEFVTNSSAKGRKPMVSFRRSGSPFRHICNFFMLYLSHWAKPKELGPDRRRESEHWSVLETRTFTIFLNTYYWKKPISFRMM